MKKILFVIIVIAVMLNAAITFNGVEPFLLSNAEYILAVSESDKEHDIYLTEIRGENSIIYRINAKGVITALYKDTGWITLIETHNEKVYYLRENVSKSGEWTLIEISADLSEAREVYTGDYALLHRITSLSSAGEKLLMAGVSADNLYAYTIEWKEFSSEPELNYPSIGIAADAPDNDYIISAAGEENSLYILLKSGRVTQVKRTETSYISQTGINCALSANKHGVCFYDGTENLLRFEKDGFVTEELPENIKSVYTIIPVKDGRIILAADENGKTFLFNSKTPENGIYKIKLPVKIWLSLFEFPPLSVLLPELILYVILIISAGFLLFSQKVAVRTTSGFAFALSLLLMIMAAVQTHNLSEAMFESRLEQAVMKGGTIRDCLDGYVYPDLKEPEFYNSEEYQVLPNYFRTVYNQNEKTSQSELLFVTAKDIPVTAVTNGFAYGLPARNVYSGVVIEAVENAVKNRSSEKVIHRGYAVGIVPCYYGGRVSALIITYVWAGDIKEFETEARRDYIFKGLILVLSAVTVMFLLNRRLTKPLRKILKRMGRYADGNFSTDNKSKSYGDAGAIERAMSEIGVSLAINEYETKTMVNSFYRFVPRGIQKLLNRSGITEINSGDAVSVTDNICVLSVENREEAQSIAGDSGFMNFVNDCFLKVHEQVQKQNGMLLSGDFNLSALPILFPAESGASSGLRFGLDLIGVSGEQKNDGGTEPDFFMILHNAKFLYGIAGTEEKAFPFLSSYEMNFLNSYSRQLRSLQTRVVMTEQYYNCLKETREGLNFSVRFIGFISSKDGRYSYKLYELLNCYPDSERIMRLRYDDKFQKAIRLFLKNDFYLARSEFSSILRSNPDDGVARWYIFACEHFFNSSDLSKVTYNLFGIDEKQEGGVN
ncbi:MAG: hypothetical protein FWG44_05830 [Oscillospiraceae bacterium]|nr:hypothetical protein [Oscillospiraceae bacterium]